MSSFTPRLSLKRNDGADPFKRQDFTDNWDKIDAAPGRHICTSTARPGGWGAAQAGRQIVETDTLRVLEWSGSAWVEPRNTVMQWGFAATVAAYLNSGVTGTYTLGTITASRPMNLTVFINYRVATRPYLYQQYFCRTLIDDVDKSFGGTGFGAFADQQTTATQYDDRVAATFGVGAVNPGNHTIKGRVQCGTSSSNNIFVSYISCIILATAPTGATTTYL